jgi:NADH-quinone oxidoreductase subunit N
MSVFPFHFWAPDVYQGSANQVTAFIATASKMAAAAVLLRIFATAVRLNYLPLEQTLVALAIITMTLGNLAAIAQTDMKRMLAYSSISQAGYILVGVLTLSRDGFAAVVFYAAAYLVMTFAAFMILVRVGEDGRDVPITGFAGLYKRSPLLALTLMVALLSLGGVPPFVGFTGKWFIFSAAMERHYWWLVLIGVINSTISVYYYLMVVKQAYLREPVTDERMPVAASLKLASVAAILLITFGGVAPARLLEIARLAAAHLI